MTARMKNPAGVLPGVVPAVRQIYAAMYATGVDPRLMELVHLRVSQVNGCSACVHAGVTAAKQHGETDERLHHVAAWRESEGFTDAERAALAMAEAATRMTSGVEAVPDEQWAAAAAHFDEQQMAAVITMVALTNFFNRVNGAVREPAGTAWE